MKAWKLALGVTALSVSFNTNATLISPDGSLANLGFFEAGSYTITGSGVIGLVEDDSFLMQPDGTPVTSVTTPGYEYFNPNGSYTADGVYGPAGDNALIGSLIGTLSSNPTSQDDWFYIGYSYNITLSTDGYIYAALNDTDYSNNTGSYDAVVTPSAVPVPAAVWLFGSGLIGLAGVARRKKA